MALSYTIFTIRFCWVSENFYTCKNLIIDFLYKEYNYGYGLAFKVRQCDSHTFRKLIVDTIDIYTDV